MANTILGKLGNSQFRSCLLLICCFAVALSGNTQVTLLFENFDGVTEPDLPAGWSTTFVEGVGFRTQATNNSDFVGASGANNVVIRNSDPEGAYTLYSPVMNTLGKAQVNIQWGSRVSTNFLASGSLTPLFEYSIDGGSAWIALEYTENSGNSIWSLVNEGVAIVNEDFDNQPELQFRWTVNIVNAPDGSYRMDDVFVSGMQMGCMDDTACNYNPDAQWDDGSCTYPGCNNSVACNYNADAGCDDGSCTYPGCTNSFACNYNADAGCDDDSCLLPGCTDSLACNYDSLAVCSSNNCSYPGCINPLACNYDGGAGCDDGTCILPNGCIDTSACNYNSQATCDDGSCTYPGCTDSLACNYDSLAVCSNNNCTYPGCINPLACNYDGAAGCDDGSCILPNGCNDSTACNFDALASCNDGSCIFPDGCNDSAACNFDALAQCDNGTCAYPSFAFLNCDGSCVNDFDQDGVCDELSSGCSLPSACNYDLTDTIPTDDICYFPGCIDLNACNYNDTAACTDNSCTYAGCIEFTACNYDSLAGCDDGSCLFPGCTDSIACNFDESAACNDNSCLYPGCTDTTACNYEITAGCDDGSCVFPGCTDSAACNYESAAACDNGSCVFAELYFDCAGNCLIDSDNDGICDQLDLDGCMDSIACNFNAFALSDDGSCTFPGCLESSACNYEASAGCDDGSCVFPGCTDITACNFVDSAGCDDGSCLYISAPCDDGNTNTFNDTIGDACICEGVAIIAGCTDSIACNYDALANTPDSSCQYIGDVCNDGDSNTTNDTLSVDCICQGTTVGLIENMSLSSQILVYPNPAEDHCTIELYDIRSEIVWVRLIDFAGNIVKQEKIKITQPVTLHRLDVSIASQGVYLLEVVGQSFALHNKIVIN